MAKRSSERNIEPAVQTMTFTNITAPGGGVNQSYIDLSQCASIINRRFYRQGLNWAVAGFKITAAGGSGLVQVSKVQNTWVTSGAWEKTMRHWLKQQNDAIAEAGAQSAVARFRDYKVFMDDGHVTQYIAAGNDLNATNLIPFPGQGTGSWQASQIVVPNDGGVVGNTVEYLVKMYGGNDANAKDIIEGYRLSRSIPQDPDPNTGTNLVSSGWLSEMTYVGDSEDEVIGNAQFKNRFLPYDADDYPGSPGNNGAAILHDQNYITTSTIGGTTRLKGGNFPCGLIKLTTINLDPAEELTFTLQVDLVPGHHRGYLCESMTEM